MLLVVIMAGAVSVACRYEKYDKPMDKRRVTNGDDPFQDELDNMEAQEADLNKVCQLQCDWKPCCMACTSGSKRLVLGGTPSSLERCCAYFCISAACSKLRRL